MAEKTYTFTTNERYTKEEMEKNIKTSLRDFREENNSNAGVTIYFSPQNEINIPEVKPLFPLAEFKIARIQDNQLKISDV